MDRPPRRAEPGRGALPGRVLRRVHLPDRGAVDPAGPARPVRRGCRRPRRDRPRRRACDRASRGAARDLTAASPARPHPPAGGNRRHPGPGAGRLPGVAVGRVATTSDGAARMAADGPVILVRPETSPHDMRGLAAAAGIVTARGGPASHAAVVARAMGKPAVVGIADLIVDVAGASVRPVDAPSVRAPSSPSTGPVARSPSAPPCHHGHGRRPPAPPPRMGRRGRTQIRRRAVNVPIWPPWSVREPPASAASSSNVQKGSPA